MNLQKQVGGGGRSDRGGGGGGVRGRGSGWGSGRCDSIIEKIQITNRGSGSGSGVGSEGWSGRDTPFTK